MILQKAKEYSETFAGDCNFYYLSCKQHTNFDSFWIAHYNYIFVDLIIAYIGLFTWLFLTEADSDTVCRVAFIRPNGLFSRVFGYCKVHF